MCGITGFIDRRRRSGQAELSRLAGAMANAIQHRGPDAHGVWVDEQTGVALGHRRLCVMDVSDAGAQPMLAPSEQYVVVYNGEIYNFAALRTELEGRGHAFRGHSDTEVLVNAFDAWGMDGALARIKGMFAIALWDRREAVLHLARDRAGKKPLYYGWFGETFAFGSELKALRRHPDFDDSLDRDAIGALVSYGWIPGPRSVHAQVRKLAPGSLLTLGPKDAAWSREPAPFWSAREIAEKGDRQEFEGAYTEAVERLDGMLRKAVSERMVADVELGALLSGGIDSSTVVALMQELSDRPVKTFSIGFSEPKYNEAEYAAKVAAHLGTDHRELYVSPAQALDVVETLPVIYDEPFADSSQIPTYLVSRMARQHVTVALSGDGGDETLAGYNRYFRLIGMWRDLARTGAATKRFKSRLQHGLRERSWRHLGPADPLRSERLGSLQRASSKLGKRWCHPLASDLPDLQARDFRKCLDGSSFVLGAGTPKTAYNDRTLWADVDSDLRAVRQFDYISYLTDGVLTKVDRASMAVSLEVRCPLLDTDVLEFAWSLPDDYVADGRSGKRVLKDVLSRYVPRELIDRPKRGFGVPVGSWIVGPLREWAEDQLSAERLEKQGIFDAQQVRQLWGQHACGWANHSEALWSILMFQAWLGAQS